MARPWHVDPTFHTNHLLTMLEATMVVLDTTEYMRNGDYFPSRLAAEREAAFSVFSAKMRQNPQNSVGLMTLSGTVKVSFVSNSSRFQVGIRETEIEKNEPTLASAIQVAQLALRHRHQNQRQRIVVFIGSPVRDSERELQTLAARLKKNSVALDVINFGQEGENSTKLQQLVNALDTDSNSHFLDAPPGLDELMDQVARSAVLREQGAAVEEDDFGAGGLEDDPELAMALRMSLEEERQRQEREAQQNQGQ